MSVRKEKQSTTILGWSSLLLTEPLGLDGKIPKTIPECGQLFQQLEIIWEEIQLDTILEPYPSIPCFMNHWIQH
ncbi:hypothetical protein NPIL_160891 [Nephila pilipes]|uniref:Uncharacterized protein n=1 Tax=Nephila pilipes TaxID=299642 RepID=A0A8X6TG50_NEPPI|nr:hypothetical protein NPIL_160891 [Nephila pilipes]